MSGRFITMMFGLCGSALAIYHTAKPERKKVVGGLMLSAALTSFLTGITEPHSNWHRLVCAILRHI